MCSRFIRATCAVVLALGAAVAAAAGGCVSQQAHPLHRARGRAATNRHPPAGRAHDPEHGRACHRRGQARRRRQHRRGHRGQAAPDGYTILMGTIGTNAINQTLYKSMPYQPLKDLVAVTQVVSYPLVVVVNPKLPINSVADLIAYASPVRVNSTGPRAAAERRCTCRRTLQRDGGHQDAAHPLQGQPAGVDGCDGRTGRSGVRQPGHRPALDQGGQAARHRRHGAQALAGRAGRAFGIGNAARLCDDVLDRRVRTGGHAAPGGGSSSAGDRQGPGRPQGQAQLTSQAADPVASTPDEFARFTTEKPRNGRPWSRRPAPPFLNFRQNPYVAHRFPGPPQTGRPARVRTRFRRLSRHPPGALLSERGVHALARRRAGHGFGPLRVHLLGHGRRARAPKPRHGRA